MALPLGTATALDPDVVARAVRAVASTGSLTFLVGDDAVTYRADGDRVAVEPGRRDGDNAVRLDPDAWDQLVGQMRTFVGLFLDDRLTFERGGFDEFADWDPLLRYLHAGIPPYDPARAEFRGRDPGAALAASASDAELAEQLSVMGFLHVKGVFTREEMAAADAEIDRLAAAARPGDDESWWVRREDGTEVVCRLVYASLRSALLASIESDPRVRRLGTLLDPTLEVAPDRMEGSAVLLKVPGRTSGLSNIPWHQDCGTGGHAVICPALSVGIQITGSDASTGNLQVVPGSHGQALRLGWPERMTGVPVVSVDTEPGDVTVHVQDVMHASPTPTGEGGRRTMYVTFYPRTLWDHIGPGEALNDLIRNRTEEVGELRRRR